MKNQEKFDKIAEELGWTRPNEDVFLFVKEEDEKGYMTAAFPPATGYEEFKEEYVDEVFVNGMLYKVCCHTKFRRSILHFIIPLLSSDYYNYKNDRDKALFWAKKAMVAEPKLEKTNFLPHIRREL